MRAARTVRSRYLVHAAGERPWHSPCGSAKTAAGPSILSCAMPIYEYRRPDGSTFEILQSIHDETLTKDPETGVPVERVFHPVAVHFKGKGFHNTDYGTKRRNRELEKSAKDGADKHDAKMADKAAEKKKADKKADAKPAAKKAGSSGSSSS